MQVLERIFAEASCELIALIYSGKMTFSMFIFHKYISIPSEAWDDMGTAWVKLVFILLLVLLAPCTGRPGREARWENFRTTWLSDPRGLCNAVDFADMIAAAGWWVAVFCPLRCLVDQDAMRDMPFMRVDRLLGGSGSSSFQYILRPGPWRHLQESLQYYRKSQAPVVLWGNPDVTHGQRSQPWPARWRRWSIYLQWRECRDQLLSAPSWM